MHIKCTSCESTLNVPESARGKRVRCSNCQATIQIPGASASGPSGQRSQQQPVSGSTSSTQSIRCPSCQATLRLAPAMAGKVIRCTKCQTQIRVPGSQPAAPTNDVFDDLPTSGPADDPFGDLSPVASQNAGPAGGSFVGSSANFTPPSTAANPYATPASTSQQTCRAMCRKSKSARVKRRMFRTSDGSERIIGEFT